MAVGRDVIRLFAVLHWEIASYRAGRRAYCTNINTHIYLA
jgi:hypothetical protein